MVINEAKQKKKREEVNRFSDYLGSGQNIIIKWMKMNPQRSCSAARPGVIAFGQMKSFRQFLFSILIFILWSI